jgi:hypothetical protein
MRYRLNVVVMLGIAVVIGAESRGQSPSDEFTEAAIRQIRLAAQAQRDGSHLSSLAALRQLRDPSLRPFFEGIIRNESWPMQVHAALALAEGSEGRKFDTSIFLHVAPEAQESIIATGLDLGLLDPKQLAEVLGSQNLVPMARLFALAELVSLKIEVDRAQLMELSKSEDPHISGLASALLAQLGDAKPFADFQAGFTSFTTPEQREQAVWLMEAFRRYKLTASAAWLKSLLAQPDLPNDMRGRAILTLLELEPEAGLQVWRKELERESSYQWRTRLGLLLLANAKSIPAETYDALRTEESEPLIEQIITAGKAAASGGDQVQPLCDLLLLGHSRTSEWVMSHLKDLPAERAAKVYEFILDRAIDPQTMQADSPALAIEAATKLFEMNPDSLLSRLQKAEDDGPGQQTMILGLLDVTKSSPDANAKAMAVVSKIRRIGSGKADSLVLLLIAKHSPTLSQADVLQLGRLAAGGGRLSDALQVQAAWLFLKHTGQIEKALTQVFAKD